MPKEKIGAPNDLDLKNFGEPDIPFITMKELGQKYQEIEEMKRKRNAEQEKQLAAL